MKNIYKILIASIIIKFIAGLFVWHPDVNNHIDWGIRFWADYGAAKFYAPESNVWNYTWPNQPPGSIYIYAAVEKLYEFVFSFFWFLNVNLPLFPSNIMLFFETNLYPALLKLPGILADLGIAWLIWSLFNRMNKEKIGTLGAIIFLVNPAVWYNSAIWGQTDAVISFFALFSFMMLFEKRLLLAITLFLVSIYIKISLIIFLPVFVIVVLRQKYSLLALAKAIFVPLAVIGVLTLPFSVGEPFSFLYSVYTEKVLTQQLQVITANAFNIWATIAGIYEQPHSLPFIIFSYDFWGKLLFAGAALPALLLVYKKQDYKSVFWSLAIISFSSFMLLTNMHERYLYPLFPVFAILAAENKKLLPIYWGVSGINILNLYHVWWMPRVQILIDIMSAFDRLLPRLLGLVNFGLFVWFYKKFKNHYGK